MDSDLRVIRHYIGLAINNEVGTMTAQMHAELNRACENLSRRLARLEAQVPGGDKEEP
jgi:hypothetical protein